MCWFQVRMTCRAFTTDLAAFFSCWVVLAVLSHFPIKVLEHDLLNMPSSSLSPFKYLHLGLVTVDVALLSHFRHFFSRLFFCPQIVTTLAYFQPFLGLSPSSLGLKGVRTINCTTRSQTLPAEVFVNSLPSLGLSLGVLNLISPCCSPQFLGVFDTHGLFLVFIRLMSDLFDPLYPPPS